MIQVQHLRYDYPQFRALHDVSFILPAGSVTALVGPNGAGKSTLMRCIAGLDVPLMGSITVNGIDVQEQPRLAHACMGYLSDSFGLYGELSVQQCLQYAAASQGLRAAEVHDAVLRVAVQVGLNDKLQASADNLSRGQRQRVAIGQAIVHQPKVLLLDEPASGLDPEARSQLATLFRQLQAQGMTILVSSHILAELDEYSTHMLALHSGRVLEQRSLHTPASDASTTPSPRHLRICAVDITTHPALAAWLAGQSNVHSVQPVGQALECVFTDTAAAQAALLGSAITHGFAITQWSEQRENLQQSYLKSLRSQRLSTV